MSRLLSHDDITISHSKTIISFDKKRGEWHRTISIDGKPAYEIGNACGTCNFYFERLDGANQSIHPEEVIEQLNEGMTSLDKEVVGKIAKIIPNGKYKVMLLSISPKLISPGSEQDYFAHEEVELWGVDGFWGMPHHPKINYYRGEDQMINKNEKLFEFLVPIFPQNWLDKKRVEHYKEELNKGKTPTAISLSVLDIKAPFWTEGDEKPKITGHWCLAHYILDGHHKLFAAAELNKKINLLCFLALEESVYRKEDEIETLLEII